MAVYGPVHILPYNPHAMNYLLYNFIFKDHQCLSPLTLWIGTSHRRGALDTTICDKVCQLLAAYRWISPGTPVYSTNKTDHHDITEMLLKVVLSTITPSTVFDKIKRNVVVDKWHLLHFELISEDFPCPNEYFKCTEGHCVAPQFVCDGHKHCIDGDDEINCGKYTPLCFSMDLD
jgi:hypothetical protein